MNAFFKDRAALLATVILVGQAVVYYTNPAKEVVPAMAPWSEFPSTVKDWKAVSDTPLDREVLDVLQPDDYLIRDYISSDRNRIASLFVGYFSSRRNGHNPHSPEWCLPGAGWKSLSTRVVSIPIPSGTRPLPANEYLIEKGMNKDLVLYWYHQGERTVSSDLAAQIYALPDLITHGRTDAALVRIIVPVSGGDVASARAAARDFAGRVYPIIHGRFS
jgi:EpsI family protein